MQTLLLLGGNPVFDSPSDMGFCDALRKVKNTASSTLYQDETSEYSSTPAAHYLNPGAMRAPSMGQRPWRYTASHRTAVRRQNGTRIPGSAYRPA